MFEQRVVRGNTHSSNIVRKPEPLKLGAKPTGSLANRNRLAKLPSVASTVASSEQKNTSTGDGSVEEWRYKVGVDGEPAVGITLQLIDLPSGAVIWTASGSKTGWSREGLTATAQKLLVELTAPLSTRQRSLLNFR